MLLAPTSATLIATIDEFEDTQGLSSERLYELLETGWPRRGRMRRTTGVAGRDWGAVDPPFTGAVKRRLGRFELARGGTIFLDEIGDVSPKLQAGLLRALQEREIERVGGSAPIAVDLRVVARRRIGDLRRRVHAGSFREDLYYRVNVLPRPDDRAAAPAAAGLGWAEPAQRTSAQGVTLRCSRRAGPRSPRR